ncbi:MULTISPECIES: hypothetical protein [unclassified Paenibacillus]|uniref:hypothetical protein n=1 Tax=unclassified Paenibacillus TaxID=185978 RepID=UPI001C10A6B1|nr:MULTISPECIES: hypothetical protein [unclassified Paenibacillus]MBU5444894.1 hypothetical protein [Paenibacillus sp. MSJ-34]CAH0121752.1 hypothetical protein PAE9249_04285 [Paenibacillus sp. CECT 9249]
MAKTWMRIAITALCIATMLSGCAQKQEKPKAQSTKKVEAKSGQKKKQTTKKASDNRKGKSSSGKGGQVIDSRIKSSGLYDSGHSSTIEAMFHAAGMTDVKVLVHDKDVYIADPKKQLQKAKWSLNTGNLGKGHLSAKGAGHPVGAKGVRESNMNMVVREIRKIAGDQARIFIVSDSKALSAMDRVKSVQISPAKEKQIERDLTLMKKNASKKEISPSSKRKNK